MLTTAILKVDRLTMSQRSIMFDLYAANYAGAIEQIFQRDLSGKDSVIVLFDEDGIIKGFSTLVVFEHLYCGSTVRVIYSGDTIIDRQYWGENNFSKAWLEFAGALKSERPDVPLYWLLIVKGHRTYRYLSLFSSEYFPRANVQTPVGFQNLMDELAVKRFGKAYDASSGLIRFEEPRSYLTAELAEIPSKDLKRSDVQYFLERNPLYYEGDELLCLCELKSSKMTKLARRWFEEGARELVS